jgi:hypothetical protein
MGHIATKYRNLFILTFSLLGIKAIAQTDPEFHYTNPKTNKEVSIGNFLGSFRRLPLGDCLFAYGMVRFKVNEKKMIDTIEVTGNLPDTLVKTIRHNIIETQNHWLYSQSRDSQKTKRWFVVPVFVEKQSANGCNVDHGLLEAHDWMNQLFDKKHQVIITPTSYLLAPMIISSVR